MAVFKGTGLWLYLRTLVSGCIKRYWLVATGGKSE